MHPLASILVRQFGYLISNLTKNNLKSVTSELIQIADLFGLDGVLILLRICLELVHTDQSEEYKQLLPSRTQSRAQLLSIVLETVCKRANFSTAFYCAVRNLSEGDRTSFFDPSHVISLTPVCNLSVGVALSEADEEFWRLSGHKILDIRERDITESAQIADREGLVQQVAYLQLEVPSLRECASALGTAPPVLQLKKKAPLLAAPLADDVIEGNCLRSFSETSSTGHKQMMALELDGATHAADVMEEAGYSCSSDVQHCRDLLGQFSRIDEAEVARIAGMVARTHSGLGDYHGVHPSFSGMGESAPSPSVAGGKMSSWNIDVVVNCIQSLVPTLDWSNVVEHLDFPGFIIPDQKAFAFLISFFVHALPKVPIEAICGRIWNNAEGQLSFFQHAVSSPPELFSFAHSPRCQPPVEGLHGHKSPHGTPNHAWLSLDLLEILCRLGEAGHVPAVRAILEYPLKHCPEVLLVGLAYIKTEWNMIQSEVMALLLPTYIGNNPNSSTVLHLVWPLRREAVVAAMTEMHSKDPSSVSRILDVCQDLKVLPQVLDTSSFAFAIDLASLASRREYLNLEKWLQDNINIHRDALFQACLKFLREKTLTEARPESGGGQKSAPVINLSLETTAIFFKVLQVNINQLASSDLAEETKRLYAAAVRTNPRLLSVGAAEQTPTEVFASDIEEEANSYFQKIYAGQRNIDEIVDMLKRFNRSSVQREQEIFACMIQSLFDEYRFFSRYPDKELHITSVLFGSLIRHQLVSSITLGIALRCVLDALRKPPDSKMFSFGFTALEQFVDRLVEWPQYCNHILQISHVRESQPRLVEFVERALGHSSQSDVIDSLGAKAEQQQKAPSAEVPPAVPQVAAVSTGPDDASPAGAPALESSSIEEAKGGAKDTPQQAEEPTPMIEGQDQHLEQQLDAVEAAVPAKDAGTLLDNTADLGTLQPPAAQETEAATGQLSPSRMPEMSGPDSLGGTGPATVGTESSTTFGHTLNIETLVAAAEVREKRFPEPSPDVQDKVAFIINNISTTNLEQKAKELVELLDEKYYPWFGDHMVMKRVSIEPNHQALYVSFLDKLSSRVLQKEVMKATYENCRALLASDLIKTSADERVLLRNLGSWLGMLTIGKNQPLRAKEIDPKSLILEAYQKGAMIAIIPFVKKVLELCSSSLAYQPPNPWTMGIVGLLAEVYQQPGLKLNLKFDIETLFASLGLDLKEEVKPTQLLVGLEHEKDGNPDFSTKEPTTGPPQMEGSLPTQFPPGAPVLGAHQQGSVSQRGMEEKGVRVPEDKPVSIQSLAISSHSNYPSQIPSTVPNLAAYISYSPKLGSLTQQLQLTRLVPAAMERAIREVIAPVVERSCTIATRTTKELVTKDFVMEADEARLIKAAHMMVQSLAGSVAHVTVKEPLRNAITNHLKSLLRGVSNGADLDQAIQLIITENLDLGCAVVEKAATEKGLRDLDEQMAPQMAARRKQRDASGPSFFDAQIYAQGHLARLPEALRPKPGRLTNAQQRVYEDFARLPWQNQGTAGSTVATSAPATAQPVGGPAPGRMEYSSAGQQPGFAGQQAPAASIAPSLEPEEDRSQPPTSSSMLPGAPTSGADGQHEEDLNTQLESRSGSVRAVQSSVDAITSDGAASNKLPGMSPSTSSIDQLPITEAVLSTGEAMEKYQLKSSKEPGEPESIQQVVDQSSIGGAKDEKGLSRAGSGVDESKVFAREDVPAIPGFYEQASALFDEWILLNEDGAGNEKSYAVFLSQLQHSMLKSEESAEWFFHVALGHAAKICLASEAPQAQVGTRGPLAAPVLSFAAIDLYAKLIIILLKYYVDPSGNTYLSNMNLLLKVLNATIRTVQREADAKLMAFNPRPYFRLLVDLLAELSGQDASPDSNSLQVLLAFANALQALQPIRVPSFSFAWLELVSHRLLMPKLLLAHQQKGWPAFQELLVALFKFMEPYLRSAELSDAVRLLYKGTLRVLLVLLHDFPEFLSDYHFSFCDVIPASCIQMRNLILSAFPRNMRLPDPFTPNLKVDLLPEIGQPPRILSDVDSVLRANHLKNDLDEYLKTRQPASFLAELKQRIMLAPVEAQHSGTQFNRPLLHALVLYTGIHATNQLQSKLMPQQQLAMNTAPITHSAPMDIFQHLASDLNPEGRYIFLNAIANQLRYPNNHTHYFSCVLLYIFAEATQEIVQEQVTRVLLERLIVNRPHPWGLLITFIELIKNPRYSFWSHGFTRCAPEIEKLFESVARSCMGPTGEKDDASIPLGVEAQLLKG